MRKRFVLASKVLLSVLLTGCGTVVSSVPTNPPIRPMISRSIEEVEVFTSKAPARAYVEVAYLEAQQQSGLSEDDAAAVLKRLHAEAAKLGCDGLIVDGPNDSVVGSTYEGTGSTYTLRGFRGTCIQWTELDSAETL